MKQTVKMDVGNALMIAHRGLSGLEKENTNFAFVAAANRSYWGIESDVRKTADGYFVMIHDKDTKHVAGVNYIVKETDFKTLREVRLLDVDGSEGREGLCIPTLAEYLHICRDYGKTAVLEIKSLLPREDVEAILQIVEAEYDLEKTVLISFGLQNLTYARELRPNARLQFLVMKEISADLLDTLSKYGMDLDISYKILTRELVDAVHALGFKVNVWTVNHPDDAERLISLGVDYITTNILE